MKIAHPMGEDPLFHALSNKEISLQLAPDNLPTLPLRRDQKFFHLLCEIRNQLFKTTWDEVNQD